MNETLKNRIKKETVLSNGLSISETEKRHDARIEQVYLDYWRKGVSPKYQDNRCTAPNEFIAANSDGSEDLVIFDPESRGYTLVGRVAEKGKGKYAHLTASLSVSNGQ